MRFETSRIIRHLQAMGRLETAGEILAKHPGGRAEWCVDADIQALGDFATRQAADGADVYMNCHPRRANLSQPGTNADVVAVQWLVADIDPFPAVPGVGCPDADAIGYMWANVLKDAGFGQRQVLYSGRGFWALVLIEPVVVTDANRAAVLHGLRRWVEHCDGLFTRDGWRVDRNVADLRRVMRLSGTRNSRTGELAFCSLRWPIKADELATRLFNQWVNEYNPATTTSHPDGTATTTHPDGFNTVPGAGWPAMIRHCRLFQFLKKQTHIPHRCRMMLCGFARAAGDAGFVHYMLDQTDNYKPAVTDYQLRSLISGAMPYGCQTLKALVDEAYPGRVPADMCDCQMLPIKTAGGDAARPSPVRFLFGAV